MRILTVCLGNICRSPAAEAAIREEAQRRGVQIELDSAGTGAYHVGDPPDPRMRAAGVATGLAIEGVARKIDVSDFDRFDLILVMDRQNLRDVLALAPDESATSKVRMFRSFDPEADSGNLDVPDPYYGGEDGFSEVIGMARRAAEGLIDDVAEGRL